VTFRPKLVRCNPTSGNGVPNGAHDSKRVNNVDPAQTMEVSEAAGTETGVSSSGDTTEPQGQIAQVCRQMKYCSVFNIPPPDVTASKLHCPLIQNLNDGSSLRRDGTHWKASVQLC
jgi:hypothetical protein